MRHDGTAPTEAQPQPSSMLPGLARELAEARLVTEIKVVREARRLALRTERDRHLRLAKNAERRLALIDWTPPKRVELPDEEQDRIAYPRRKAILSPRHAGAGERGGRDG
jgi:hypothetical protein